MLLVCVFADDVICYCVDCVCAVNMVCVWLWHDVVILFDVVYLSVVWVCQCCVDSVLLCDDMMCIDVVYWFMVCMLYCGLMV